MEVINLNNKDSKISDTLNNYDGSLDKDFVVKRLLEIENHFTTISDEEFEEGLQRAGIDEIESLQETISNFNKKERY